MSGGNDKKDLTSVIDLSKNYKGPEPGSSDDSDVPPLMEDKPIEKISDWESIEAYSAANPMPEVSEDDFPINDSSVDGSEAPPAPEESPALPEADAAIPETDPVAEIAAAESSLAALDTGLDTPPDAPADALAEASTDALAGLDMGGAEAADPAGGMDFGAEPMGELPSEPQSEPMSEPQSEPMSEPLPDVMAMGESSLNEPAADLGGADFALAPPPPAPESDRTAGITITQTQAPGKAPPPAPPKATEKPSEPRKRPDPLPEPAALSKAVKATTDRESEERKKQESLTLIRAYAQNIAVGKPAVAAAYPFSLLITGKLNFIEKAKIIDLVSTHNMGFSEVDLEPQLEAGRILLPRISEYAGVLIIQALRDANVTFQFGPSDTIFATEATASTGDDLIPAVNQDGTSRVYTSGPLIPAEEIPVTTKDFVPGWEYWQIVDTISVSAALTTSVVEAQRSSEYTEALDNLKRELRLRAYRRKAQALINFKITLDALALPTHYRLTLTAAAVVRTESWVRPEAVEPVKMRPVVDDRMVAELIDPEHKEHKDPAAEEPTRTAPLTSPAAVTPPPPPPAARAVPESDALPFSLAKEAIADGPGADVPDFEPEEDTFVLGDSSMESADPAEISLGDVELPVELPVAEPALPEEPAVAEQHDTLESLLDAEPNLDEVPMELPPQLEMPAEAVPETTFAGPDLVMPSLGASGPEPAPARKLPPRAGARVEWPDEEEEAKTRAKLLREEANQRPPRENEPTQPKMPRPEPPLAVKEDGTMVYTTDDATRSGKIALPPEEPSFKGPPQIPAEALPEAEAMGVPAEALRKPATPPPPPPPSTGGVRDNTGSFSAPRPTAPPKTPPAPPPGAPPGFPRKK